MDIQYEKIVEKGNFILVCGMTGSGKTTLLKKLKEYFKDKTKDFIEKYKEEVQQRAEHKQKLRETSEKGTRRKDYDSKVRLLENVLKNSESKEDILFELIHDL